MVRHSKRKRLIYELDTILEYLIIDGKDSGKDFDDLMWMLAISKASRFVSARELIPKCDGISRMFWDFPDDSFRQLVRMDKVSFRRLYDSIKDHPIFISGTNNEQTKVWVQLMVVLNRLGCDGNGASIGAYARLGGISYGSVVNFTNRVFTALLDRREEVVKWPTAAERRVISARFAENHGLEGAVGIVDGTPVNFAVRPHINGEVWFNRKQRYAMNVQLICDDRGRITYFIVGWPGSVFDATVLGQSAMAINPHEFFSNGEYLLADAGYAGTWWCCTPYRNPQAQLPINSQFNELFSSARVKIEHVNGIWKGRFASLKNLRIQVKQMKQFGDINRWIVVCIILHNLLLSYKDTWDEEDEGEAAAADEHGAANDAAGPLAANELRNRVQLALLNWFFTRHNT